MAGFEDISGNNNNNDTNTYWDGHHLDNNNVAGNNDELLLRQGLESMTVLDKSNWMEDETKAAVVGCVEDSLFDNFQSPFHPRYFPFGADESQNE